jgi:hypothetical protein
MATNHDLWFCHVYFLQHLHESFCSISVVVWKYLWHFQCNGVSASVLFCLPFHYQPTHTHTHTYTHTHTQARARTRTHARAHTRTRTRAHTHTHTEFPNESPIIHKIHCSEVMNVFCRSNLRSLKYHNIKHEIQQGGREQVNLVTSMLCQWHKSDYHYCIIMNSETSYFWWSTIIKLWY